MEMGKQLEAVSNKGRIAARLQDAPEAVHWLTDQYVSYLYSPLKPGIEHRNQAIREWSRLRIQLLWAALIFKGESVIKNLPVSR
jgi:hypothetical protein